MEQINFKNNLISTLESTYNKNQETLNNFKSLITNQPLTFFGKKSNVAHITASALVINEDCSKVLLTHHRKLKEWLQLGGHWCDYEEFPSKTILEAACKEIEEEAFNDKKTEKKILLNGNPLDLDIHSVGDHSHYDVTFLVQVSEKIPVHVSEESIDVKWISIKDIIKNEDSYNYRLVRMCKTI